MAAMIVSLKSGVVGLDVYYPVPKDEAARLDALRTYNILDTAPEREFDELTRLAAQVCGCPMAAITLVDQERTWYKSRIGLPEPQSPRSYQSFCSNAILGREVLEISDTRLDPRFVDSPSTLDLGVRFYTGVPLVNRENLVLGTLCVLDRQPRTLTPEQVESLSVLSRQVMAHLELRRLAAVGEFRERLISILSHDLRQPLQQILLAARQGLLGPVVPGTNEQRYLTQISISAERMTRMMRDVLDFTQTRLGNGLAVSLRTINVHSVSRRIVQEFALSYPGREIQLELTGDGTGVWDENRIGQAVSNLLANAIRYGDPRQPVRLTCAAEPELVTISVWNAGEAIPPDVMPRLFAPFCRSNASRSEAESNAAGLGLGLFIVREIATACGGTVEASSSFDRGTTFRLKLPRREPLHADGLRSMLKH